MKDPPFVWLDRIDEKSIQRLDVRRSGSGRCAESILETIEFYLDDAAVAILGCRERPRYDPTGMTQVDDKCIAINRPEPVHFDACKGHLRRHVGDMNALTFRHREPFDVAFIVDGIDEARQFKCDAAGQELSRHHAHGHEERIVARRLRFFVNTPTAVCEVWLTDLAVPRQKRRATSWANASTVRAAFDVVHVDEQLAICV